MEKQATRTRIAKAKQLWQTFDGQWFTPAIAKHYRDLLAYWHGQTELENVDIGSKKPVAKALVTTYDPGSPRGALPLQPGPASPVCAKCGLCSQGAQSPFIAYRGAEEPIVTVVFDQVTRAEDAAGQLVPDEALNRIARIIQESEAETGVKLSDVRWVPMTRCCPISGKKMEVRIKGAHCRAHVVDDLLRHPPKLIIPVGSAVLGLLSHKSNVQDWQGRLLTYRGWPDDWLTNPDYMLPQADRQAPLPPSGHPVFGDPPQNVRIPMVPVQTPRVIMGMKNAHVTAKWKKAIVDALCMASSGVEANSYLREWYRFTEDPDFIEQVLDQLISTPKALDMCYDTETTGVRPWAPDAKIVSIMMRWDDPITGEPASLGFPWDFEGSAIKPHIKRLKAKVWRVITKSKLIGHNLTFDVLYTFATFWRSKLEGWDDAQLNRKRDACLCMLANAGRFDTWHAAFAAEQKSGSLGLEALMYKYFPELAGYEEDMTLLIQLHSELLDPKANKGGHYLNCPKDKWPTHLVSYVMGDVEGCYEASKRIKERLAVSKQYAFPLAKPGVPGQFRLYTAPRRDWLYKNIMSPAASMLMKLMGRGFFVNQKVLSNLEVTLPEAVKDARKALRKVDESIEGWCAANEASIPGWELDLENKTQLRTLLFDILNLPVQRLTKNGRKLYGEDPGAWDGLIRKAVKHRMPGADSAAIDAACVAELREMASMDKFTLNHLAVSNEHVRPLLDYRKVYRMYSTYIRPMRNIMTEGIDKKERVQAQHLCFDSCIHSSFLMTGTRGGRLSSRSPNLQNLPRDGVVKQMFTSRFGARGCIYQSDLSQIELRLMATACGDPTMLKAYHEGLDLHSLTASRVFNKPYENFSKDYFKFLQSNGKEKEAKALDLQRTTAKTVNFLTGYGGGAFGLQNVLANNKIYLQKNECEDIIMSFFDSYPALKRLLQHYKQFILDRKVAVSVFGRVRFFEEAHSDDREIQSKALRAGCNHLIQSTAADMMLIALIVIEELMRQQNLESIMVSTVHDSLVIDAIQDELPVIHEIVLSVLNNFPEVLKGFLGDDYDTSWMLVPFTGDSEVGKDYLSMYKLETSPDWDKIRVKLAEAA